MYRHSKSVVTVMLSLALVAATSSVVYAKEPRVSLSGNQPIAAKHGKKLAHKNAADQMEVTIGLQSSKSNELDAFLADLYNPSSPNYKHFISPDQFGQMFGATDSQINQVSSFFKDNGLDVISVNPERTFIKVRGPVGLVEKALQTTINVYQNVKGETYYANDTVPTVPESLGAAVNGIYGLDNEVHWKRTETFRDNSNLVKGKPAAEPHIGSGPSGGYTPNELRSAYDVSPLNSAGMNGTGQSVALFELDGYVSSNISTYSNYYGLGSPSPSTVLVDGYNGAAGQGEGEVELDIEIVNAMAPKANVLVYEGPNSDQGVIDTYQKIATDNKAKSISTSWGLSELQSNTSTMNAMHTIFQQMSSQGQSIYAAAGDSGAYDGGGSTLAVDSPANDPYVTGVGGTNLKLNTSGAYGSEAVWGNSTNKSGGGGGISTIYAKPSWQTGPGTSNSYSNGNRQVPDVAADADPSSGYSIYSSGSWVVYGGTSCAAPLWAAMSALNNQYAAANGKPNMGYANPTLYKMFNTTQPYNAYHDVVSGNNLYYPATSGYDQASGIGSPDAYNLIRDINGSTTVSTGGSGSTAGSTGTVTQLITNGGFESGKTPWVESSSGGYELIDTSKAHSGSYSLYLGGYNGGNDAAYQQISVPSTVSTASLTYYTYISTSETTHSYDFFKAQIRDTNNNVLTTLQSLSDANAGTGWVKQTFDLSAYKGKTIRVYFNATTDYSNPTNFFVDDVSVTAQ